jgi:hypothetical protein
MEDVNTGSKEIDEIDEALRTRPRASAIGFSQSAIRLDWAAPFHPLNAEVYERIRNEMEDRLTLRSRRVGRPSEPDPGRADAKAVTLVPALTTTSSAAPCSSARAPLIAPSRLVSDQFEIKDGNRLRNSVRPRLRTAQSGRHLAIVDALLVARLAA